jgi:superfamily II DNA/RNA helicase
MECLTDFSQLPLADSVKTVIQKLGLEKPTAIQSLTLPPLFEGRDVFGFIRHGTGKTLAFCLPIIRQLELHPGEGTAVIVTPSKEMGLRTAKLLKTFIQEMGHPWTIQTLLGRADCEQLKAEHKSTILIAAPKYLVEKKDQLSLSPLKIVLLDDTDKMLEMGHGKDLLFLKELGLPRPQFMMTTSTHHSEIEQLKNDFMSEPVQVEVGVFKYQARSHVIMENMNIADEAKLETTKDFLNEAFTIVYTPSQNEMTTATSETETPTITPSVLASDKKALLFTRTKHRAERISKQLEKFGFYVSRIHGDRSFGQKQQALQAFNEGTTPIMVTTDVSAREMEWPHIDFLINYDLPAIGEDYVERLTYAGKEGRFTKVVNLLTDADYEEWRDVQRLLNPEAYALMEPRPKLVAKIETPSEGETAASGSQSGDNASDGERNSPSHREKKRPQDFKKRPHVQTSKQDGFFDEEEDDYYPQPSLEEQMNSLDRYVLHRMRQDAYENRNQSPFKNGGGQHSQGNRKNHHHRSFKNRRPNQGHTRGPILDVEDEIDE